MQMIFKLLFFVILFLSVNLSSCSTSPTTKQEHEADHSASTITYAKGFEINSHRTYRKVSVTAPWQKSKGVSFDYYLVDRTKQIPPELAGKNIIRTPVSRVICLSTTHVGFVSALNEVPSIQAISGASYVSDSIVRQRVANKQIADIGYDQGINYELILSLKPDLIIAYGVGSDVTGLMNKLHDLGLPVVLNGEYLEETPLAKAEWIKFIGAFYGKDKLAEAYFKKTETSYKSLSQSVSAVKTHPVILTGLPFKDAWWMAGGHSNLAALIKDAGGEFLWKDNASREAFVVSLEEVVVRSAKADYWLNCGSANSIKDIIATDSRFTAFPQVQKKAIFNNNLRVGPEGGNDYWELGVVRPDLILSDLIKIFHPECDSITHFNFYKQIIN
jgi:iron complex transport system substrate-binding protein